MGGCYYTEVIDTTAEAAAFHMNSEQAALLDIPFLEVTREAVSHKLGAEPEILSSGTCVWEKGVYTLGLEEKDADSGEKITSEDK